MASLWCVSAAPTTISLSPPVRNPNCGARSVGVHSVRSPAWAARRRRGDLSVCMRWSRADEEEEERPNRHPLDIPLEYVRPKPPNKLNVFPKFPAMETPLIDWLPFDEFPDDEVDEDELDEEEQEPQPME
ncbi:hypothetical protein LUZ60_002946 [Juncus effusus]|nr:hypothetical protein LUZ60_002946 [Juncus effusus]